MTDPARPPTEAEEDRARAEAEKARAEAEAARLKAAAEATQARAEARRAEAEAMEIELRLAKGRHDRDREEEKRQKELVADHYHHVYRFTGQVDLASVQKCIDQLNYWDRTEAPSEFTLELFSPGGSVIPGMALFDHIVTMRAKGWHVTTTARGYAASMGGILLQAGDVRTMGKESYVLIHEVQAAAMGTMGEIEDEVEFLKKMQARILAIFAERSKLSVTQLRNRWKRKNWWLDSDEAVKLGIVDEVR
jgi:ATP-dependent Clp endopeptidase proteolytic subunit ClpP